MRTVRGTAPPLYLGGLSEDARDVATQEADVYLMWPDTMDGVATIMDDMRPGQRRTGEHCASAIGSMSSCRHRRRRPTLQHSIWWAALDPAVGDEIRSRSLDSQSVGVRAQATLRESAAGDGFVEQNLWTGIGHARSGCGAAIVGDPQQVAAKIHAYQALGIDTFILSRLPAPAGV